MYGSKSVLMSDSLFLSPPVCCGQNKSIAIDGKVCVAGLQIELNDTPVRELVLRG